MSMQKDDDIPSKISAADMADALIRSCGWSGGREKAHTHVLRCVEMDQAEEAVFWTAVRNALDHLVSVEPNANEMIH